MVHNTIQLSLLTPLDCSPYVFHALRTTLHDNESYHAAVSSKVWSTYGERSKGVSKGLVDVVCQECIYDAVNSMIILLVMCGNIYKQLTPLYWSYIHYSIRNLRGAGVSLMIANFKTPQKWALICENPHHRINCGACKIGVHMKDQLPVPQ